MRRYLRLSELAARVGFARHGANNHIKRGPCLEIPGCPSMRSSWERNVYRVLRKIYPAHEWDIEYERLTLVFVKPYRRVLDYKPDFAIYPRERNTNEMRLVEVKGYLDSPSRTRLTGFKKYYPHLVRCMTVITGPENFPWLIKAMPGITLQSYNVLRGQFDGLVVWEK